MVELIAQKISPIIGEIVEKRVNFLRAKHIDIAEEIEADALELTELYADFDRTMAKLDERR